MWRLVEVYVWGWVGWGRVGVAGRGLGSTRFVSKDYLIAARRVRNVLMELSWF